MLNTCLLGLLALLPIQDPTPGETLVTAPRSIRTATDTPAHVTVIDGEELRRTGRRSLPAALAAAGQVWVQETNLGGGAPIIRGLVGNQVLLVVDGVRINDATTRCHGGRARVPVVVVLWSSIGPLVTHQQP